MKLELYGLTRRDYYRVTPISCELKEGKGKVYIPEGSSVSNINQVGLDLAKIIDDEAPDKLKGQVVAFKSTYKSVFKHTKLEEDVILIRKDGVLGIATCGDNEEFVAPVELLNTNLEASKTSWHCAGEN